MCAINRFLNIYRYLFYAIQLSATIFVFIPKDCLAQTKFPVILDADTGNEVDDLYAIVQALLEPSWEIKALNATQWQTSHWAEPQSMENSHRLNQVLLGYFDRNIPTKRGGISRMFDWGDLAQHSAAAYTIINESKKMQPGEKINVVALGALTNVGSALYIDPSIANQIRLYWLGTSYDFEEDILKKQDFNCVMDVQALETVLMSEVEMHVIPVNVANAMTFTMDEIDRQLRDVHPLGTLLADRWEQHLDGSRKQRTIWDLALIQAITHPEWTTQKTITTSRDNGSRSIKYYQSIDAFQMKQDFFRTFQTWANR